jgi:tetratricopeptide (TPR) repeat protein
MHNRQHRTHIDGRSGLGTTLLIFGIIATLSLGIAMFRLGLAHRRLASITVSNRETSRSPGSSIAGAQEEITRGKAALEARDYETAIEHFKRAAELDSRLVEPRFYLASIYEEQFSTGGTAQQGKGEMAIAELQELHKLDPTESDWMKSIARIDFKMKKLDDAKSYYQQAAEAKPTDAEALYGIGFVDWNEIHQSLVDERTKHGLVEGEALPNDEACMSLQTENSLRFEGGINALNRALQLRPGYADAMTCLSFIYRGKAELECKDPAKKAGYAKAADKWIVKATAARVKRQSLSVPQ